jgi:hypothetical protein
MQSLSDGCGKKLKAKNWGFSRPYPQTFFLPQSRSASNSVSVYASSTLLVTGAPQYFAACRPNYLFAPCFCANGSGNFVAADFTLPKRNERRSSLV